MGFLQVSVSGGRTTQVCSRDSQTIAPLPCTGRWQESGVSSGGPCSVLLGIYLSQRPLGGSSLGIYQEEIGRSGVVRLSHEI